MDELKVSGIQQKQSTSDAGKEDIGHGTLASDPAVTEQNGDLEESKDVAEVAKEAIEFLDTESYIRELTNAIECHMSLRQIPNVLLHDEAPRETVRRMMEILIQKDEKWLNEEAGNDTRILFFSSALRRLAGFKVDYDVNATMEELKRQRFNESFLGAIVAALPEITLDIEHLGKHLTSDLHGAQNPSSLEDIVSDMDLGR